MHVAHAADVARRKEFTQLCKFHNSLLADTFSEKGSRLCSFTNVWTGTSDRKIIYMQEIQVGFPVRVLLKKTVSQPAPSKPLNSFDVPSGATLLVRLTELKPHCCYVNI